MRVELEQISKLRFFRKRKERLDLDVFFQFRQHLDGFVAQTVQSFGGHVHALLVLLAEVIDQSQYADKQQDWNARIDAELCGTPAEAGPDFSGFQNQGNDHKQGAGNDDTGLVIGPVVSNEIRNQGRRNQHQPQDICLFQLFFHSYALHRSESIDL